MLIMWFLVQQVDSPLVELEEGLWKVNLLNSVDSTDIIKEIQKTSVELGFIQETKWTFN